MDRFEEIEITRDGKIATVIFNRPDRMNSYTLKMARELLEALNMLEDEKNVRVVVLKGKGKAFCAGYDLDEFSRLNRNAEGLFWEEEMRKGIHRVLIKLRELSQPTIACINGAAIGGGLAMAMACDLRVASKDAVLGDRSLQFGFIPDDGGLYLLPKLVGQAKAFEMLFLGKTLTAKEAEAIGLVNMVVEKEELDEKTKEIALKLSEGPPLAQALAKRAFYRHMNLGIKEALEETATMCQLICPTEDVGEGIRAFKEKRPPKFKGR